MIATIEGTVSEKFGGQVVVDVQGLGYGLFVTPEDHGKLKVGEEAKLYVYEHIRENSHDLFGFSQLDTKYLFEQLLSVSGVGPKMALAILNVGGAGEVRQAIASGDVRAITTAPGVGKKIAERVVVDLKDKVGLGASTEGMAALLSSAGKNDEAVQALIALGLNLQDAISATQGIDKNLSTEERVKLALKNK